MKTLNGSIDIDSFFESTNHCKYEKVPCHLQDQSKIDNSLKIKSITGPHGNEHSLKHDLLSDCSMCSPVRLRILISTATVNSWYVPKLCSKTAFYKLLKLCVTFSSSLHLKATITGNYYGWFREPFMS